MTDETPANSAADDGDTAALLSRLSLIEERPLENRAAAFAQVHDELRARLDS